MGDQIQRKIDQIKAELHVDFTALALSTISDQTNIRVIRWQYVSGNINQHYRRIRLQVGKGIGGIVWRTGRSYQATHLQSQPEQLIELPITRMEKLETVVAYPVMDIGEVKGVLLVGYREVKEVSNEFITAAQDKANELKVYL
ncbi:MULTISPECIES: GAF domain-containing protein [unclassified Enterococcus]|uniref:GAF domain-containing protein n=1 Tax=unclassified Enterococcus TaxID=2608891 RepID=UPI001CE0D550|nr:MULTISPECIES: GAF domain-containing protein [unclassified Enterococcus]MCA5013985.1 GAF domain-containing protein [Enterococcus sp. S23]MCA5017241.1 GAF domain-containing protein [Enterococcus sp. S22(2020)]